MAVAIITGSGTYALPDFEAGAAHDVETPYGPALVTAGAFAGTDVLHVSRHGEGHARLSNHVNHRANVWALRELGAAAVIGCTACGAVDRQVSLGGLIVFDDLHFISNRLPDGSLCTLFGEAGHRDRGHWIIGPPFSAGLREALRDGAKRAGIHVHGDGGVYGHVDGPRFNTVTVQKGLDLRAAEGTPVVDESRQFLVDALAEGRPVLLLVRLRALVGLVDELDAVLQFVLRRHVVFHHERRHVLRLQADHPALALRWFRAGRQADRPDPAQRIQGRWPEGERGAAREQVLAQQPA